MLTPYLSRCEARLTVRAGCVTFASNRSTAFELGMSFAEIHGAVPHDLADGAIPRAAAFLMRVPARRPGRRINATSTAGDRLDTALDSHAE